MARLKSGTVPSLRRHKPSGRAVVTLSGQDFYCGTWGTKTARGEYDRQVAAWMNRGRQPLVTESSVWIRIQRLILRYLEHAAEHYRKNGRPTNEVYTIKRALKVLRELHGRETVEQFGPLKLRGIQQAMIRLDWSRTQINKQVQRIVRMFAWGVSQELVPADVLAKLREVPGLQKGRTEARESAPVLPVDEATIDATLAHLPPIVADLVRLQRLTGCRPDEVLSMRPIDVDRTAAVWAYRPASHKTEHHDRERVVFIGPKGQEILEPYLDRNPFAFCFCPAEGEAERRTKSHAKRKTPLSCGNRPGSNRKASPVRTAGDRYTIRSYGRAIARAAERAGVGPWSPNRLRHSAATEIRKRFGLEAAQVTLGHAGAKVTQIYAERDQQKAAAVMAEVG
jgi:integrase